MDVAIVGLGMHPFGRTPSMSGLEQGAAAAAGKELLHSPSRGIDGPAWLVFSAAIHAVA